MPSIGSSGQSPTVTDSSGTFVLGVDAPLSPIQGEYRISVGDPLTGQVAPELKHAGPERAYALANRVAGTRPSLP